MLFTFEKGVRSCARAISGVASFLSTNDHLQYKQYKQGCYFPAIKLCFLRTFAFSQIYSNATPAANLYQQAILTNNIRSPFMYTL